MRVPYSDAISYGTGPIKVGVLSPILSSWPADSFFQNSLSSLYRDCTFYVYDCLCGLREGMTCEEVSESWKKRLAPCSYEALMGFAFGGSILQTLLLDAVLGPKKFIFVSAPCFANETILTRLGHVVQHLEADRVEAALTTLDTYVFGRRKHHQELSVEELARAKERLLLGFNLIFKHDARATIRSRGRSMLTLYGEQSLLAEAGNIVSNEASTVYEVPRSGMRVLEENNALCTRIILDYLKGP